jgi:hypothetical protein
MMAALIATMDAALERMQLLLAVVYGMWCIHVAVRNV